METKFEPVTIIGLGINPNHSIDSTSQHITFDTSSDHDSSTRLTFLDSQPTLTCILGDPIQCKSHEHRRFAYNKSLYMNFYRLFVKSCPDIPNKSSIVLAWNDNRVGSDSDLRNEEYMFRQHRHDLKKYDNKYKKASKTFGSRLKIAELPPPPILQRSPISNSVQAVHEVINLG